MTTHNGWTNYETWAVYTWLSNAPATDERTRLTVKRHVDLARGFLEAGTVEHVAPLADAGDELRDWLTDEDNPLADEAGIYSTLLTAALGRVDWREIARHYLTGIEYGPLTLTAKQTSCPICGSSALHYPAGPHPSVHQRCLDCLTGWTLRPTTTGDQQNRKA